MTVTENHEALATELEAAEKALSDMQKELDVLEREHMRACDTENGYRLVRPVRGRHAELLRLAGEMTSRVEALRDHLAHADKVIAYAHSIEERRA